MNKIRNALKSIVVYLKPPRRSRKHTKKLLKKQSLNQGIFTKEFLMQFLTILMKKSTCMRFPPEVLKAGDAPKPPRDCQHRNSRRPLRNRCAYCCVLLCTTVYYCVLLYTTVYCCVLLYTTLYYCILLCTAVYYCAPAREIACRQEPLTCRKTSQIQMQ